MRPFGKAEDPLADDRFEDLVGAAADPVAGQAENEFVPRECAPLSGVGGEAGSEDMTDEFRQLLERAAQHELAEGQLGTRLSAATPGLGPPAEVGPDSDVRVQLCKPLPSRRVGGRAEVLEQGAHAVGGKEADPAQSARPDGSAFVHQGCESYCPPGVDVTESVAVGNEYVVDEDLVERCTSSHLTKRSNRDAGLTHVDEEGGEVPMPWFRRRSTQDLADVREVGTRCPHLLTGHSPPMAVASCARCHRRQIGSRSGFAEELAGDQIC